MYQFQAGLVPPPMSTPPDLKAWALFYTKLNLVMTPLSPKTKKPCMEDWNKEVDGFNTSFDEDIEQIWSNNPQYNIGCLLSSSGLCVLDIDNVSETQRVFTLEGIDYDKIISSNVCISSGRPNKAKALFKYPLGETLSHFQYKVGRTVAFELRCGPLQDVLPPSIHPDTGRSYVWQGELKPWKAEIQPLPEEVLKLWKKLLKSNFTRNPGPDTTTGKIYKVMEKPIRDPYIADLQKKILHQVNLDTYLREQGVLEPEEGHYLCPFHDERSSSFWTFDSVQNQEKQGYRLWHCAHGDAPVGGTSTNGIGSTGDVIHMFQFYNKIDYYPNAVKAFAKKLGLTKEIAPEHTSKNKKDDTEKTERAVKETESDSYLHFLETLDIELFRDEENQAYATIFLNNIWDSHLIESTEVSLFVSKEYSKVYNKVIRGTVLKDLILKLKEIAATNGVQIPVKVRVGEEITTSNTVSKIYLDTMNNSRDIISITNGRVEIIEQANCPIRFARNRIMLPLPTLLEDNCKDDLLLLKEILNVTDDGFKIVVAWLLFALHPRGPYPILTLHGEQGTAKSCATKFIRSLVDPNLIPLRGLPGYNKEEDLYIAAKHAWISTYENVSGLSIKLSDLICTLATGAGFTKRKLYTDDDESYFLVKRPQIINGIEALLTKGDQAERTLVVELQPITQRRTDMEVNALFNEYKDRIFTALLNATATAMCEVSRRGALGQLPVSQHRMADFYQWVICAETALPWPPGELARVLAVNQEIVTETIIDGDPIATAIIQLMENNADKSLTLPVVEMLNAITATVNNENVTKAPNWPKTPWHLSNRLTRVKPLLRLKHIEIAKKTSHGKHFITIWQNLP